MRRVAVEISDDAEIALPLAPKKKFALRFTLRRSLIGVASVKLAESEEPGRGEIFLIRLRDFCPLD